MRCKNCGSRFHDVKKCPYPRSATNKSNRHSCEQKQALGQDGELVPLHVGPKYDSNIGRLSLGAEAPEPPVVGAVDFVSSVHGLVLGLPDLHNLNGLHGLHGLHGLPGLHGLHGLPDLHNLHDPHYLYDPHDLRGLPDVHDLHSLHSWLSTTKVDAVPLHMSAAAEIARVDAVPPRTSAAVEIARVDAVPQHTTTAMEIAKSDTPHVLSQVCRTIASAATHVSSYVRGSSAAADGHIDRKTTKKASEPMCIVCLDATQDCLLEPCMHICICMACSASLTNCPKCRGRIVGKPKKVYVN